MYSIVSIYVIVMTQLCKDWINVRIYLAVRKSYKRSSLSLSI